ncbi:hypothetical protein [Actinomadura sp. 9N407]|uniref:hypothetical protein n=1 Tax=Actinomadura sp. 9N407 TaxID=3375154 RepID=UPI0037AAD765
MPSDKEAIGARLRQAREAPPYWTRGEFARLLRAQATPDERPYVAHVGTLTDMIKQWESGKHLPSHRYRRLYARVTGRAEAELFGRSSISAAHAAQASPAEAEFLELAARADVSALAAHTLELLDVVVDRLCRDYPTVSPVVLTQRGKAHLDSVMRLLDGRTTLAEHRELLVHAGWISALLACTLYDAGDPANAEVARRTALRLGEQAGHGEIIGWAWEIAAWFALVERRYDAVVTLAEEGLRHAGETSGAVQLTLQAGRGYARMGDRRALESLKAGRAILDRLPRPDHPDHHFVFDHDKYEFYCSTIYTMLGHDEAAEEHAREVVAQCRRRADPVRWPMRLSMVHLDLGQVAGRRGDLDEAVRHGRAALVPVRRSGDLLPRAAELHRQLEGRWASERRVADFAEQLRHEQRG